MKDHPLYTEFIGPRAVEFRFRFSNEYDANNFADSFDDHFPEIESVGVTRDHSWSSSAIAPEVPTSDDLRRLQSAITSIAMVHHGVPDGLQLFDLAVCRHSEPEARKKLARGEAKRNPWNDRRDYIMRPRPEGSREGSDEVFRQQMTVRLLLAPFQGAMRGLGGMHRCPVVAPLAIFFRAFDSQITREHVAEDVSLPPLSER